MILTILLNDNPEGKVGLELNELTAIIEKINTNTFNEIIFDFTDIDFINPTLVLGLSTIISELEEQKKKISCVNKSESLTKYFAAICFPAGLIPENITNWSEILKNSEHKTFLPIINFSTDAFGEKVVIRNNIISQFAKLLSDRFEFGPQVRSGILYFISEYTDNIVEHSGVDRGRLFYQFYPTKEFVEISIIDCGKTILGSYKEKQIEGIQNDKIAIEKAFSGVSTKSPERGRGLRTSTNLIVEGMQGHVFLLSGEALYINNGRTLHIISSKKWKGTILTIKIPKVIPETIQIYDFIT